MTAFPGLAERIRGAFAAQTTGLVLRRGSTLLSVRAVAAAPASAVRITFGSLPSGMTGVAAGDSFGNGTYTISGAVEAMAGTIADVPFDPPLRLAMSAGAAVQIVRNQDLPCRGWVEWLDTSRPMASNLIKSKDAVVTVFCDSLAATPAIGDRILAEGRVLTVENVGRDAAGTAWALQAAG